MIKNHIESVKISELSFAEYNPRQVSKNAIDRLAKSLSSPQGKELFKCRPILANKRDGKLVVYAGNMRLRAAQSLGMKEVPCIVDEISLEEEKERNVKDNLVIGEWDDDILANNFDLKDLEDWGMDLKDLGIEPVGAEETAEVPAVPAQNRAQIGHVYKLGRHSVMCGDSTNPLNVSQLLSGVKPLIMVTDPPYGVDYDANWRNEVDRENGKPYGARAIGKVINDCQVDWSEAFSLFEGNVAYIWHAGKHSGEVQKSIEECGFEVRSQIIWAKQRFVISRGDYHWQHEPCFYAVRKGQNGNWQGDRSQSTLWEIEHVKSETGHSTQKPVDCMARPIQNNTQKSDVVYDPFLGSGTTLIAAEKLGRTCYGMEIDPKYVDVIIERYSNYAGADKESIYQSAVQVVPEGVR